MENKKLNNEELIELYGDRVKKLTLLSGKLARIVFVNAKQAVQCILQIIYDKKIEVEDVVITQQNVSFLDNQRAACFDVVAKAGKHLFVIELENSPSIQRAISQSRYYHKAAGVFYSVSKRKIKYDQELKVHIIYLMAHDIYKMKKQLYCHNFDDGLHFDKPSLDKESIIYFNCSKEDSTSLKGKLAHDMKCNDPKKMYLKPLRKLMELAQTRKVMIKVCEEFKNYGEEAKAEGIKIGEKRGKKLGEQIGEKRGKEIGERNQSYNTLKALLSDGFTNIEALMKYSSLSRKDIINYARRQNILLE